ncbi:MAG: GDP-mannose 4,6-dehydratase [Candidatus Magasanikbacteria bacterium]|nr:GDP-mannose 4,6-dehydratase [Candidatus Magasanikbacteria bacterium]
MITKKALITGIDGFVGPYLKAELANNGYDVFGLSLAQADASNQIFKCDISDRAAVAEIIKAHKFDYIFHLAGFSSPQEAERHPELVFEVNVNGTINLLDALVEFSPTTKILIVSSSYAYGHPKYLPINEQHPLAGTGAYAASRIAQEKAALTYTDRLALIITRSFNHTGPGQMATVIIPKIIQSVVAIKQGKQKSLLMGNSHIRRDITDVRDVVRAYRLLMEQRQRGLVCNVCRGESISLQEVIDYIKIKSRISFPVEIAPELLRKNEPLNIYGDTSLLKSLIVWNNLISYPAMLDDIYDYYLQFNNTFL